MSMTNIEVTFNDDGTANIKLPEGKVIRNADPAKVAELTLKLAKALGPIIERHAEHSHIKLTNGSYAPDHTHEHE